MPKEIERKFLVLDDSYKKLTRGVLYKQGYLNSLPDRTVRVRVFDQKGFITVKGKAKGLTRLEYEYGIPYNDAVEMIELLCEKPVIEKLRFKLEANGSTWEVDEFLGDNEGLVIAEIELESEEQEFEKPSWVGEEVTMYSKYSNSNLVKAPYKTWKT